MKFVRFSRNVHQQRELGELRGLDAVAPDLEPARRPVRLDDEVLACEREHRHSQRDREGNEAPAGYRMRVEAADEDHRA
jgi:hypothetical protein